MRRTAESVWAIPKFFRTRTNGGRVHDLSEAFGNFIGFLVHIHKTMLGKYDVVAFVRTIQPDRAKAFYNEILGPSLLADTPFALVFQVGATTLRIAKVAASSREHLVRKLSCRFSF